MPEVLGLNLAMELSGVGGTYRRARLALKEYGFSTRFVDIHNTVDNVATGHSAWAADAIDTYLSSLLVSQGRARWTPPGRACAPGAARSTRDRRARRTRRRAARSGAGPAGRRPSGGPTRADCPTRRADPRGRPARRTAPLVAPPRPPEPTDAPHPRSPPMPDLILGIAAYYHDSAAA